MGEVGMGSADLGDGFAGCDTIEDTLGYFGRVDMLIGNELAIFVIDASPAVGFACSFVDALWFEGGSDGGVIAEAEFTGHSLTRRAEKRAGVKGY
jgi:hypothetical protein